MKTAKAKNDAGHRSRLRSHSLRLLSFMEQTRQRAHQIYLARGWVAGCELDDWLQAEREVKACRDPSINV